MVLTNQLPMLPDVMCTWYYGKDISIDVLRQIKLYIYKHFNYSRIFNNVKDLMDYLAKELVIRSIVFIICSLNDAEAKSIDGLVREHSQYRWSYRLKLEHHASSALPELASVRSMLEKHFGNIIENFQTTEQLHPSEENIMEWMENVIDAPENTEQLHPSEENIMEGAENVIDELPPLFGTFQSISVQCSFCDLTKESLKFLLLQSIIEVLIRKHYEEKDLRKMWNLCCKDCPREAQKIQQTKAAYKRQNAIRHYTESSFLFRLVNRAFRLEDIERIFRFGCYIADVHQQLEELANNKSVNQNTKMFFRGKRYSTDVVQQFKDSIKHLISLNGLLSTSEDYDTSTMFSGFEGNNKDYQSVIFEININCTMKKLIRPYANISEVSTKPDENEVLFFMGFVWKLKSMEEMLPNTWYIVLESCTDCDTQLIQYIEESRRSCTYLTIGNILRELGDYANATNFYQRMLKEKNLSDETCGHLYFNMAMLAEDRGEYLQAQNYLQQAETFIETTPTHSSEVLALPRGLFAYDIVPSRMRIFNNLGRTYLTDGEYESAQECFEDALREPGSEIERATVLNNYGLLEFELEHNEQARDYIGQAVQLAKNDACSSEFKRNLRIILERITSKQPQANQKHGHK